MNNLTIRHYNPLLDLANLSAMLTEIESVDQDGEETSEEYLLASLNWPNYHPDKDVWIVEMDGRLVGYALALEQPSKRCTLYVVVHPSQRRKGIGSKLLELVLERAQEVGSKNIMIYANEKNEASNLFLKQHGLSAVGSSGAMKTNGTVFPAFEFPEGFTLEKYSDVNDTRILLSALNQCYQDMWGHQHNDNPSDEEIQSPNFLKYYDAENILLLFDPDDKVTGICSVKPEGKKEKTGSHSDLLDAPGILKEYRHLEYQRPMVLAGVKHLHQGHHKRPIVLEFWGDDEAALNIYRSLGFETTYHYVAYHKELE